MAENVVAGQPSLRSRRIPRSPTRPNRLVALGLAGMGLALLVVPADAARHEEGPPPSRGPETPGVASSPYRDQDRDRVYDDLEAAMAARADNERLPVIVVLTHPLSDEDLRRLRAEHGEFPLKARWSVLNGFAAELTKGQITSMARRPNVVQIEPEVAVQATMGTARSRYGVDKAVLDFGVNGDRDGATKSFTTTDVVSCVLDTGIDAAHADLNQGQVIAWKDYVNGRTTPYDDNGHGTHVAGIAAGQGDASSTYKGVAFGSALVGVKVLDSAGGGTSTAIINGIDFCVANRAAYNVRVLNLSLGSSGSSDGTDAMSVATNNAFDKGVLPVVAAGNAGPGAYTIGSPGAAAKALTVCSLADPGERGFFASSFSSRGPTADGRTKPDVCGPGHAITAPAANTSTGYTTMSGTSMATPFIAGVAALMLDANNALTPTDLKGKLASTSQDWRSTGADDDTGSGRAQAYEALKSSAGLTGTGPPGPSHYMASQSLGATGSSDYWSFKVTTTGYPIALTLVVPGASTSKDFDLYLYNPAGSLVARSETTARQETIAFTPTSTGTYRARVRSYKGTGSYHLDFSYGGSTPTLTTNG